MMEINTQFSAINQRACQPFDNANKRVSLCWRNVVKQFYDNFISDKLELSSLYKSDINSIRVYVSTSLLARG